MTACPLCGGESKRRFERHGVFIRDCDRCGHRFAELAAGPDHVRSTYDDRYFTGGGAGYSDYLLEGPMLVEYGRWYARLLERYAPVGRVFEIGSAAGFWLSGMAEAGWEARGIEPNATMADYARARLGLDVRTAAIEEIDPPEPASADLVAMIQVIAHFADPRRAFSIAFDLLAPGGLLLVETWNRDHWSARALGKHWHEYSPPSVLHWFSRNSLRGLGAETGFEFVAAGRPRKRIAVGHALSLLRHKYRNPALRGVVAGLGGLVPDRLAVSYPTGDIFWMLLRRR